MNNDQKNALRSHVVTKFKNLLTSFGKENSVLHSVEDIDKLSKNIEINIFNFSVKKVKDPSFKNPEFITVYKNKFLNIFSNLDPNSYIGNLNLIVRFFLLKELTPNTLVNLSKEEMFPERYEEYYNNQKIEEEQKKKEKEEVTGTHKCIKCAADKQKNIYNTDYYQLQTRSADEGITTFVSCRTCGKKWKYG